MGIAPTARRPKRRRASQAIVDGHKADFEAIRTRMDGSAKPCM
jgi:hypothetical protein